MWLELSNLVLRTESDLALAQSFKNLEPAVEPNFEDEAALNDLHNIHVRKMDHLNSAVQNLHQGAKSRGPAPARKFGR